MHGLNVLPCVATAASQQFGQGGGRGWVQRIPHPKQTHNQIGARSMSFLLSCPSRLRVEKHMAATTRLANAMLSCCDTVTANCLKEALTPTATSVPKVRYIWTSGFTVSSGQLRCCLSLGTVSNLSFPAILDDIAKRSDRASSPQNGKTLKPLAVTFSDQLKPSISKIS